MHAQTPSRSGVSELQEIPYLILYHISISRRHRHQHSPWPSASGQTETLAVRSFRRFFTWLTLFYYQNPLLSCWYRNRRCCVTLCDNHAEWQNHDEIEPVLSIHVLLLFWDGGLALFNLKYNLGGLPWRFAKIKRLVRPLSILMKVATAMRLWLPPLAKSLNWNKNCLPTLKKWMMQSQHLPGVK